MTTARNRPGISFFIAQILFLKLPHDSAPWKTAEKHQKKGSNITASSVSSMFSVRTFKNIFSKAD
jgi:hypothetical protein